MRTFFVTITVLLALSITAYGQTREGELYEVTIELTEEQANLVRDSRGDETEVTLTEDQIKYFLEVVPELDIESLTLTDLHLSRTDIVVVELQMPDGIEDPRAVISVNPIPSP
jgi:hypothetical protein